MKKECYGKAKKYINWSLNKWVLQTSSHVIFLRFIVIREALFLDRQFIYK